MQMMLGGGMQAGMPAPNLSDLLETLAQRDPRMATLVQQLQVRLAAKESSPDPVVEDVPIISPEPEIMQPVRHAARGQKLKRLASTLLAELRAVRARNDMLADVLGACHLCWGEDPTCVYCEGDGRIGAYLINPKVFEDVIGPAMQQVMQRPPLAKPQIINKGEVSHA
jgi:hypothetical protein